MRRFCRFGLEESLTVEDLRRLIAQRALQPGDRLQVDGKGEWIEARDVPELRTHFPIYAPRPAYAKPFKPFLPKFHESSPSYRAQPARPMQIFIASVFIAISLFNLYTDMRAHAALAAQSEWPVTTATVTDIRDRGRTRYATFTYVANGVTLSDERRARDTARSVGATFPIRYDPAEPGRTLPMTNAPNNRSSDILIDVLFVAIGAFVLLRAIYNG